jgi:hypothetical protein
MNDKRRHLSRFTTYFLLAVLLLVVPACGNGASSKIIGKWIKVDESYHYVAGYRMEFFSDGTVAEDTQSGKYTFLDDGRLRIIVSRLVGNTIDTYEVSFSDDTLVLANDSGSNVFRRVK